MLIQYYLADGQEVKYDTGGYDVTMQTVDDLAMMYAQMRPKDLPTHVFMHVSIYSQFVKNIQPRVTTVSASDFHIVQVVTGCGPLKIHAMPYAFDGFKMLVGKQEDYNRYDIDKAFEDVVLKDCERE